MRPEPPDAITGAPGSTAAGATPHHYNPSPRAHPGLHAIALVEISKGLLALLAASGLEILGPAPLRGWVHELIARFQLDPAHGAAAWLVSAINPGGVHLAAAVAALDPGPRRARRAIAWGAAVTVLAATGGLLETRDVSQRPWFKEARSAPFVGDVREPSNDQSTPPPSMVAVT